MWLLLCLWNVVTCSLWWMVDLTESTHTLQPMVSVSVLHLAFTNRNGLTVYCFGPDYNDLQVRPWNKVTSRDRQDVAYYQEGFKNALKHSRGGII